MLAEAVWADRVTATKVATPSILLTSFMMFTSFGLLMLKYGHKKLGCHHPQNVILRPQKGLFLKKCTMIFYLITYVK
jgi:hypothetical protein